MSALTQAEINRLAQEFVFVARAARPRPVCPRIRLRRRVVAKPVFTARTRLPRTWATVGQS
jgi:hypothetical protein